MQTVVLVIMILISFNFLLKQSFHQWAYILAMAVISALFVGLLWPVAVEQSKSQIAAWLGNPSRMLDTSVLLTAEVAWQMAFCLLTAQSFTVGIQKKSALWIYRLLRLFPGLLFFAVLFSLLVTVIFLFPGVSFPLVAWIVAALSFAFIISFNWLIHKLFPEEEIRLELLFLSNALVAILGIVATVNGRTAVEGVGGINWPASGAFILLLSAGTVSGLLLRRRQKNKRIHS